MLFFVTLYFWSEIKQFIYKQIEPAVIIYGNTKNLTNGIAQNIPLVSPSKSELISYNKELELTVEYLENLLAEEKGVDREKLLVTLASSTDDIVILYPLTEDITKIYSTLVFNKGSNEGLYSGQIVFIRGMQPVCRLMEVHEKTSICTLFSKGGDITEGIMISPNSSTTINMSLVGEGGGSFSIVLPKEVDISVGNEVYLRSDQHMKLGDVVSIIKNEQAIGSKVYIKGNYNPLSSSVFYVKSTHDVYEN